MALTLPSYADILSIILSVYRTQLTATVAGTAVPPDLDPGSVLHALATATATALDAFYGQLDAADSGLRLSSAVGPDLDAIGDLTGTKRKPELPATVAIAANRYVASATPVIVAAGRRLTVQTPSGATIGVLTQQDPTLPTGQAGVIASGATQGYVLAQAMAGTGASGNVGAGSLVSPGDAFPGVDYFTIPVVATPAAPVVATVGTAGATAYPYQAVARGRQGTTTPGAVTTLMTGNATLSGTNYNTITVPNQGDGTQGNALGYDILKNVGTSGAPTWQLLASTVAPTNSVNDTGQATTLYPYPTIYTANAGQGGVDPEPDDGAPGYRQRIPLAAAATAGATLLAAQAAAARVVGVTNAYATNGVQPGTGTVLYTAPATPAPAAVDSAVRAAVAVAVPFTAQVMVSQLVPTPVALTYTVRVSAGVASPSGLLPAISTALSGYFSTLAPGDAVYQSSVNAAIRGVPGVLNVTNITLQAAGGALTGGDVNGAAGVLYALGALTATAGY